VILFQLPPDKKPSNRTFAGSHYNATALAPTFNTYCAMSIISSTSENVCYMTLNLPTVWHGTRAGLNEREAPGKIVTARPLNA